MDKIKSVLTLVLLIFVGVTVGMQIGKEFYTAMPMKFSDGFYVVCTHATVRCPSCLTIEQLAKETLDEYFPDEIKAETIRFRSVDYEQPEVADFAVKYKIATASVVLVQVKNGEHIAGVNLADEALKLHPDAPAFKTMLREKINVMINHRSTVVATMIKLPKGLRSLYHLPAAINRATIQCPPMGVSIFCRSRFIDSLYISCNRRVVEKR